MKSLVTLFVILFLFVDVSFAALTPPKDTNPSVLQKTEINIIVPQSFLDPNDLAAWHQINDELYQESSPNTVFNLHVQGEGGDVIALNATIAAIQYAQAHGSKVIMTVIGPAYSAHALLICYGDEVLMSPTASLMFHDMKSWSEIGPFVVATDSGSDVSMTALENAVYQQCESKGLLSSKEVSKILNGTEITILPNGQHVNSPNRYGFMFTVETAVLNFIDYGWYGFVVFVLMFSIFFGIRKGLGK